MIEKDFDDWKDCDNWKISSNTNEVIKAVLNSLFFLQKGLTRIKSTKKY